MNPGSLNFKFKLNHLELINVLNADMICRKDVNGFFAYPVNDMIAPGYSSIILNPMDLSTMMSKIESHQYRNVLEYKVRPNTPNTPSITWGK